MITIIYECNKCKKKEVHTMKELISDCKHTFDYLPKKWIGLRDGRIICDVCAKNLNKLIDKEIR